MPWQNGTSKNVYDGAQAESTVYIPNVLGHLKHLNPENPM